jgi:hypothetical protein
MPDNEQSAPGPIPRLVQEFIGQMRASTERLQDLARLGGRLPLTPGAYPLPGALSAAQTKALADSIAAQRRSIEALKAQLTAFDEQLATMEQVLGPLAEWSRAWADLEQQLMNLGRKPEPGH